VANLGPNRRSSDQVHGTAQSDAAAGWQTPSALRNALLLPPAGSGAVAIRLSAPLRYTEHSALDTALLARTSLARLRVMI